MKKCGHVFESASGHRTTPCYREKGHEGDCRGRLLGSPCKFPTEFDTEEQLAWHEATIEAFQLSGECESVDSE